MRRRPSGSTTEEEDDTLDPDVVPIKETEDKEERLRKLSANLDPKGKRKAGRVAIGQNPAWKHTTSTKDMPSEQEMKELRLSRDITRDATRDSYTPRRRCQMRNSWSCSWLTMGTFLTALALVLCMFRSFTTRQLDPKGADMSWMASAFVRFPDFDTEHTRFASKYSLHLYREMGIDDEDPKVKGVPVLFIPGNAGSYKQVRSLASEAANYWNNKIRQNSQAVQDGKMALDFFTVDFNEDLTAFHGQTLLDQAEYLNDAVAYILSLYHNPQKSIRDSTLPDPSSVMLIGHSMGGVAARTMLTMPNYQANSVNTIITLSAPHARPPVSFDAQIVKTYQTINDYWRKAHSTQWGSDNPLWHVTLISIAGGGLDTIVPSDYSSLASLVPETHGFTVYTSTIPDVWLGMDHLSITWCDQFRKAVIRSLFDVMDASRATQTKPRGQRMRSFKKWFLTGLEDVAEKSLPHKEPKTLLTLEDNSNAIISQGERLVLHELGRSGKRRAHLLPIPPQGSPEGRKFTLLADQHLDYPGENGNLELLFCSVFPLQVGHSATLFSMNMDLSGDSSGSTRLACKNVASDTIRLPASTSHSRYPFDKATPFSYLQYDLEDLVEHQFVAIVDKASDHVSGWLIAEFSAGSESTVQSSVGIKGMLASDLKIKLPAKRPLLVDIKFPNLESGLFAYKLSLGKQACGDAEMFTPLLRQYISEVHESKFFVNVKDIEITLHGVAPYMPPPLQGQNHGHGLSLQLWTDPTCNSAVEITLSLDLLGSFGKLWMRYRTLFAALPLLVVALALRKQFQIYDEFGIFMSFSEGLNESLRRSIAVLFLSLSFASIYLANVSQAGLSKKSAWSGNKQGNGTESVIDFTTNELLTGSPDPFFWFLLPLFGVISVGLCVAINYAALTVTHLITWAYSRVRTAPPRNEDGRRTPSAFAVTSTRQRVVTTGVLLILVSTVIPYQFAFLVLCIVQVATCVRALRVAKETNSEANYNFYNYAHSILVLMLWILPINLPVLVVWIRNLAVHWLTPFSSHHNILSIMPYIFLVETLSTGRMIPRVQTRMRYMTHVMLFLLAVDAALYSVSYAYLLHQVVNFFCAWLVLIHLSTNSFSFHRLDRLLDDSVEPDGHHIKKRP